MDKAAADLLRGSVIQEGCDAGFVALQGGPHKLHVLGLIIKALLGRAVVSALLPARLRVPAPAPGRRCKELQMHQADAPASSHATTSNWSLRQLGST